ncbi:MAG TPA: adenine phosphoribosyltransferase [Acidobacteriota bacterium]
MDLKAWIRDVPDFPKAGILFKDITTLLKDRTAFTYAVDQLLEPHIGRSIQKVVGVESRGFIFAPILAYRLGAGFVPARKPGKLPARAERRTYALEYGSDGLEIHADAIEPGEQVLVVDDLLATGGTARAAVELVEQLGGKVAGCSFLIELAFLDGRRKLNGYTVHSLLQYS